MLPTINIKKMSELSVSDQVKRLRLLRFLSMSFFVAQLSIVAISLLFFVFGYFALPHYSVSLAIPLNNWFLSFGVLFAIGLAFGWSLTYCLNNFRYATGEIRKRSLP